MHLFSDACKKLPNIWHYSSLMCHIYPWGSIIIYLTFYVFFCFNCQIQSMYTDKKRAQKVRIVSSVKRNLPQHSSSQVLQNPLKNYNIENNEQNDVFVVVRLLIMYMNFSQNFLRLLHFECLNVVFYKNFRAFTTLLTSFNYHALI